MKIIIPIIFVILLGGCQSRSQVFSAAHQFCEYAKSTSFDRWQNCFWGTLQGHGYNASPAEAQIRAHARYLGEQERLKKITTREAITQNELYARQLMYDQARIAAITAPRTIVVKQEPRSCYVSGSWVQCY